MSNDIPSRATLQEDQVDGLPGVVATVRWFQGMAVAGIFAALLMALPAVVLFLGGEETMFMALVPGIPALLVLYWALATTLNRTTIVYGARLTARHSPLPWMGTLEVPSDRVTAFELREVRFVRRGRHVRSDWQAVAIVHGTPHRLLQGVSARAENAWLVGVCQRALVARKATASPTKAASAAPVVAKAASAAPAASSALPAALEQALATLRSAGAQDIDRLVTAVRPFATHLRAPFTAVLPEVTRFPQLRASLPREGQPTFGEQHLAYRPDDFRRRIWVQHMDQVLPLLQLEADTVLRIGVRSGGTEPILGIEARKTLAIDEALRRQPYLTPACVAKLTEILTPLGVPCSAIESRFDPPGLMTSTFWLTPDPSRLDACAAALGVIPSHREALAALLKSGIVPTRVGIASASDAVMPELHVELQDKAVALAIYGADTPLSIRIRAVAPPSAACGLRLRFHAESVPLIEVETTS